jgi:hypothetical protein
MTESKTAGLPSVPAVESLKGMNQIVAKIHLREARSKQNLGMS